MAKSVRSSVRKRNSAKLRSTVFGPAADARTERLAAKLQQLASQPRPESTKNAGMDIDTSVTENDTTVNAKDSSTDEKMDMDRGAASTVTPSAKSKQSNRIRKRGKKNRSSITFPQLARRSKMATRKK
ncbi:hypothetical protein VTN77DRAFT_8631 [Rasamsonia byssochlamydoides]|uniref:uncharacterized protein n=1 Tax=Rasamsonia byssochlamydoides TaxID=89139 RepID=UPI003742DBCE